MAGMEAQEPTLEADGLICFIHSCYTRVHLADKCYPFGCVLAQKCFYNPERR